MTAVLTATFFVCLPAPTLADISLSAQNRIVITEVGSFGTAEGILTELFKQYVLLALEKADLSGSGTEVTFILKSKAEHWHELPKDEVADIRDINAFEIAIRETPQPTVTITGQTPIATGHGVLFFLEKHLGVLWAFPGELGLCLPKERSIQLEAGTESVSPWIIARVMSGLLFRDGTPASHASRAMTGVLRDQRAFFLADDYFKSLRLYPGSVTHNMIRIFPVEECKGNYPELFPIGDDGIRFVPGIKGQSQRGGGNSYQAWHPCYTNPKTVQIAIAKGKQAFEEGKLFYSLGISDGRRVQCQCAECGKVGWPHSYYRFVKQVAAALKGYSPQQMVGVLAYGDVGIPPADLELPNNVLVNVAGLRKSVWELVAPSLGTYEYIYGAGYVIPNLPLDVIRENMRYYQAHDLKMYRAEFYPVWAFDAPKAYIISRLLALEIRDGDKSLEQAMMISFDLVRITKEVHEGLQRVAGEKLEDFDSSKLFSGATHTHCGPSISDARTGPGELYDISEETDVMTPPQYIQFLYERVGAGIVKAWEGRKPAGFSWALGEAIVGYNRRLSYFDGSAIMGFDVSRPDFSHVEGYEDHGVEMLFFWDADQNLTGMLLNIACPSQVGRRAISADFWHQIREGLRAKYGQDLCVYGQCAASGDQCPADVVRSKAQKIMLERKKIAWKQELANRVIQAVDNVWPYAKHGIQTQPVFGHKVIKMELPNKQSNNAARWRESTVPIEFHVIRLGDIAIATNPFELFLDYGIRIKGRSKAILTFVSQLTCDLAGYLPTRRAVAGGDYSAVNHEVGPKGGQVLVDETVEAINSMWP